MQATDHAIKVKLKGGKAYYFLTPRGGLIRLRIHAALYTKEQGQQAAAVILADNAETVEAVKVVRFFKN